MRDSSGQLSASQNDIFFEALRGLHTEPHLASDAKQTVDTLKKIIGDSDAKSVVAAGLPPPAKLLVEAALKGVRHSFAEDLKPAEALETISKADLGITWVQYAAAKNGALVEVAHDDAVKLSSCLPRVHVALLSSKTLLPDLEGAIAKVGKILATEGEKKPVISIISGPSKTADIELRLIYGVHGPHTLHVLLLDWI
ncbi:MAG: lactate utilization protein [Thaumarchaeota archaeon]|nr:lactate utilization protein [Nitrososphaerota archaeon]